MGRCLSLKLKRSSSCRGTSPTLRGDVARGEYNQAVLSNSYSETWSSMHDEGEVVQPSRECVEDILHHLMPSPVKSLVSAYFDHSETTAQLCRSLHTSVLRARSLYAPLHDLLLLLHSDQSLSKSQCDHAARVLLCLDSLDNPFPSQNTLSPLCSTFSDLKLQLDAHLRRPRWKLLLCRTSPAALLTCVGPLSEAASSERRAQLDAVAKGTFVLYDLHTIECLVERLRSAVDGDKNLVRLALEMPPAESTHLIREVLNQLRKNHLSFPQSLDHLEEQICLCLNTVNRARSTLLQHSYNYHTLLIRDRRTFKQMASSSSHNHLIESPI